MSEDEELNVFVAMKTESIDFLDGYLHFSDLKFSTQSLGVQIHLISNHQLLANFFSY